MNKKRKIVIGCAVSLLGGAVVSIAVVVYLRSIDIHRAAQYGDIDKVERILLKKPELLEARDELSYTPLHWAASVGYQNMAEMLIAKGADVNATDDIGNTPLYVAINTGYYNIFFKYLSTCEKTKIVPLKAMVEFLIANGADVNAKALTGYTPLHAAASGGDVDVAKILIANGVDVNAKSLLHGLTPLHTAAYSGHEEVLKILIDNGAEINAKTLVEGNTALHKSVFCGENAVSICKILLEKGADVNAKNSDGVTPLHQALKYDETKVAVLLRKHGGIE